MEDVEETTFAESRSGTLVPFEDRDEPRDWVSYLINFAFPITICTGIFLNILGFVILVRCRLWLKHEGYVYLATILCTNVGVLLFSTSSFWLMHSNLPRSHYPPNSSQFMCKFWNFLKSMFFLSGCPSVALLLNSYLRESSIRSKRCECPIFAAKYRTLFASKVVVGVLLGSFLVLGLPYLVVHDLENGSFCTARPHVALVVAKLIETILMFVLPFVVLLIILLLILCTQRKDGNARSSQTKETADDKQMRKMAITLSSIILLSQFMLVSARTIFRGVKGYPPIAEVVHGLSLTIHPILCFIILTMFRQAFWSQLRGIRCCRRLLPSMEEEAVPPNTALEDMPRVAES